MEEQTEIKTELEFFKKMHELLTNAEISKHPKYPYFAIKDPKDDTVYYFKGICSLIQRVYEGNFGIKNSLIVEEVQNIMLVYKTYFGIDKANYVYWFTPLEDDATLAREERLEFLDRIIKELTKLHNQN